MPRKMINVQEEVYNEVRKRYPHMSFTEILKRTIQDDLAFASNKDLEELKDKFNKALAKLISENNLKA